jgi:hypothetical protein
MHQPVLDGYFQHSDQLRMPFFRPFQSMLDRVIQFLAQTPVIALDFASRRPIRWSIRRQSTIYRINPKRKKMIECSLEGTQTKRAVRQQIPIKSLDMPDVKDNAMPLRDGPVVNSLFANHAKYLVGTRASI